MGRDPSSVTTCRAARVLRVGARVALVAYAAFVAFLSLKPFGEAPLERVIDRVGRALFHIPAYAGLAALIALALPARWSVPRRVTISFAAATACGWLLEVAQIASPSRSFNVLGLLLDAGGAAIGATAVWVAAGWARRIRGA